MYIYDEKAANKTFLNVQEVHDLLDKKYPKSNLGNKRNPLNELVYIVLSSQTNEALYQAVYKSFRRQFPRWKDVIEASLEEISAAIRRGGMGEVKARYIKGIAIRLMNDLGEVSLRRLRDMTTEEAETYLCSLPGVGIKTARCVLMYSFDRDVFPLDVHCIRVISRLSWVDWYGQRPDRLANEAQAGIPEPLRKSLHIRLVQHGRAVCRPQPVCSNCVLADLCPSYSAAISPGSHLRQID